MENKVTRLFDDFLNDVGLTRTHGGRFRSIGGKRSTWVPAIDVTENEKEYDVIVDVPGVKKEDIDIEFHDSVLVLSGHHKRDPSATAPQEINVKHEQIQQQPGHYPQSTQYQQQPLTEYKSDQNQPTQYQQQQNGDQQNGYQSNQQWQPSEYQSNQRQSAEHQSNQQPTEHQSNQQPTEHQSNQQPTEYQSNQQPTEYQSNQQPTEHQSNQQPTEYQSNQQQPTEYQSNQQQPTEYRRLKKSHHQSPHQDDGKYETIHIQERHHGHFSRSIQLPSNIRADVDFHATLENGVLKIKIPKNSEKPKRKITIL